MTATKLTKKRDDLVVEIDRLEAESATVTADVDAERGVIAASEALGEIDHERAASDRRKLEERTAKLPSLEQLVAACASALQAADQKRPVWTSRTGRLYQAGIGPHAENAAMALMLDELRDAGALPGLDLRQFIPYPDQPRQKCDLAFGDPALWVVEAKMARFRGDNGKPDDTSLKDLLSPYPSDRSALTDAAKWLARRSPVARRS